MCPISLFHHFLILQLLGGKDWTMGRVIGFHAQPGVGPGIWLVWLGSGAISVPIGEGRKEWGIM